ncbi:MAG: hypothetical protein ACKO8Q_06265, partial [Bacteroidota bacterium]
GMTQDLVTAVWVGAQDPTIRFSSTAYGQGANTGLPIFGYFMNKVYKDPKLKISTGDFEKPVTFDPRKFECVAEMGELFSEDWTESEEIFLNGELEYDGDDGM